MESIENRVLAGWTWLDENFPGWTWGMDWNSLDMALASTCVVGQSVGWSNPTFRKRMEEGPGESMRARAALGFWANPDSPVDNDIEYEQLTAAWKALNVTKTASSISSPSVEEVNRFDLAVEALDNAVQNRDDYFVGLSGQALLLEVFKILDIDPNTI